MISRRRVAMYVADGLESDRRTRIQLAAGWLVSRRRTADAGLLARDVASILAERGYVTATVTAAEAVAAELQAALKGFVAGATGAKDVELQAVADPSVIGGLKLSLPDAELDATIKTKLQTFVTEMSR